MTDEPESLVMRQAHLAAERVAKWSPAKQDFVQRVMQCRHDWETVNPGVINSQRCMRCGQWR